MEIGDSESLPECCSLPLPPGVVTCAWTMEFLRLAFLEERVEEEPVAGTEVPAPRLRFLITSVLRERGRTTPWSLRKRPQALQSGWPSGLRRHRGVVWVKQLVQVVGAPLASPCLEPPGLLGRDGATLLKPEAGGEFGEESGPMFMPCWWERRVVLGVEVVR
jgi:hypothetical protein